MKSAQMSMLAALLVMGLACGYSKPGTTPAGPGTTPTITSLNPSSVTSGSAAFQIEVSGTTFAAGAVINFNGAAQTTSADGAGKVKATIPAAAIMNSGDVPVTVTNPGVSGGIYGGGTLPATSAPMTFTVN
jgi:hypothetical protein